MLEISLTSKHIELGSPDKEAYTSRQENSSKINQINIINELIQ